MAKRIDYYKDIWTEMINNDQHKVDHMKEVDKAVELDYELPQKLKDQKWMRKIVSSVPLAVIVTGKKVLCTIEPRFFVQPLNDEPETIRRTNLLEQNLSWQFQQMDKRGKTPFVPELVESALRYDSIAAFTVPVKWQVGGSKLGGGVTPARYDASLDQGGFMTIIENPKNVHARFSPLGLDMVLCAKVMRAQDAVMFYGKKAAKLAADIKDKQEEMYVSHYDFWCFDERVVWLSKPSTDTSLMLPGSGGWIIEKGDMELPFIPWTIKEGGTGLATASDHTIRPILGPLVHTEQWELMCLVQSMAFSEATAHSAAPRGIVKSSSGETLEIDYYDINKPIQLKPGEEYTPIDPPRIDDNLLLIYDRIEGAFHQLTGLRALAELDTPSGTAFATVNAQIKAATTALDPPKRLAERALAGIAENILRWTSHTKEDLVGYSSQDFNMGRELVLKPEHIEPSELYINVILSHHVPTDELQQINAATILMRELGISFVDAAKKLDIPNPEEMLARAQQEKLNNAAVDRRIRKMDADLDLEIARERMEMELDMMPPEEPPVEGGMNEESLSQARLAGDGFSPTRTGSPRRKPQSIAARGPGFRPELQGLSPNTVNPEGFTRETMTGVDSEGETI